MKTVIPASPAFNRSAVVIWSFSLTAVTSAFLLFQIQPIIGKYILPWFGGSSSVWTTAMLFFQTVLLLGYFYAYLLSKQKTKTQIYVHCSLLLACACLLLWQAAYWNTPVIPGPEWKPGSNTPIRSIIAVLTASIGLPYFLLTTTSILLQQWHYRIKLPSSPYRLYALSNAGSLAGLISYPFIIEPFLTIHSQAVWWSRLFFFYWTGICFVMGYVWRSAGNLQTKKDAMRFPPLTWQQLLRWTSISALSSVLLLATTNQISQSVSPTPFLWLLPLSLYLLSFIFCFSGKMTGTSSIFTYPFLLCALLLSVMTIDMYLPFPVALGIYMLFLMSGFMICHGALYALRPVPEKLNEYYLILAAGSVCGSIIAGVLAPLFFQAYWEFDLALCFTSLLAIVFLTGNKTSALSIIMKRQGFKTEKEMRQFFFLVIPSLFLIANLFPSSLMLFSFSAKKSLTPVVRSRNFYGSFRVEKYGTDQQQRLALINGNIIHGMQYQTESLRNIPTTYYHTNSGVGVALHALPDYIASASGRTNIRVATVGLGVGTLAAYGRASDYFRFYEINPDVITVARTHFTYLSGSKATIDTRLGDGRSLLEREALNNEEPFDMIVLDAFSDDAIPMHLLTKEAFEIYAKRLTPRGVLAVHISNAHLDLYPIITRIADATGFQSMLTNAQSGEHGGLAAKWALLARAPDFLTHPNLASVRTPSQDFKQSPLWTDDYSNLLHALTF